MENIVDVAPANSKPFSETGRLRGDLCCIHVYAHGGDGVTAIGEMGIGATQEDIKDRKAQSVRQDVLGFDSLGQEGHRE